MNVVCSAPRVKEYYEEKPANQPGKDMLFSNKLHVQLVVLFLDGGTAPQVGRQPTAAPWAKRNRSITPPSTDEESAIREFVRVNKSKCCFRSVT